ncbi:MAG: hypothetical protein G01um101456_47 [Parcubacteria group bacterium Gr01-1014_56]|nr:MAG: hypothetical protein G01um101456_47 [Parcubacteria group bacterium Gr01-1014_56]
MKNILLLGVAFIIVGGAVWLLMAKAPSASDTEGLGFNPPNSAEGAPSGSIHNLPVPAGVAAVRTLAAKEAGVSEDKVLILTAYEKEWPDGCLGLAREGEFCTQAIVPGYEVTVQVRGEEHVYRSSANGLSVRKQQ